MVEKKKTRLRKKTAKAQVVAKENAKIKATSPLSKQEAKTQKHSLSNNKIITLLSHHKFFVVLLIIFFAFIISLVVHFELKFALDMNAGKKVGVKKEKSIETPKIGGPFLLVDHDGNTVSESNFKGKYMLVYFGYTYCPDVCPISLTVISDAMEILGESAEQITPVFITVDPERDDHEAMKMYVEHFHPRLVGLTGSVDQVNLATKAFKAYFAKVTEGYEDGDYAVDHSSITYLMDPNGKFITHFSHGIEPKSMAEKLAEYIR